MTAPLSSPRPRLRRGRALRAASFALTLSVASLSAGSLAAADPPAATPPAPEAPPPSAAPSPSASASAAPSPSASASAAPSPSAGPAAADVQADLRFHEGKALLEQGLVPEACEKLAQSLALARKGGTLLNLAACRQRQGRHATALELFQEALAVARAEGRTDRAEIAERGILDTRGKLSWLVVTVHPDADASGLRVMLDAAPVDPSAFGSMMAVDPGQHTIAAEAPGRRRFETTVTSGGAGDRRAVEIPALAEDEPAKAAPSEAVRPGPLERAAPKDGAPRDAGGQTGLLAAGASLVSVGVVAAAAGAVAGGVALADSAESRSLCPESPCSSDEGIAKNRSARATATAANVLIPSGIALAAAGGALLLVRELLSPGKSAPPAALAGAPWVAPGSGGLVLSGAW